ncbi:ImmA/IrrE family metallo-endopeptidase [Microvirga sp. HBU67558]|nr:ImmA/IrrE family metallo-endopeptidase [Microvirga sp. HBU67558]
MRDHKGQIIQRKTEVAYPRGKKGQAEFSAVTLCKGPHRLIIHNDGHHKKRQAANIAHELSHELLIHPSKPLLNETGSRHYDANIEEEAAWLGPALLISEEAALLVAERKYSLTEASDIYGASEEVVRMRLNVTSAYRRSRSKQQAA